MGIKIEQLSNRQLGMIDEKERKKFGKAGQTVAEATDKEFLRLEREDHADFSNWLLLKGIETFEHDDPVRRSRNRKGWPDFRIYHYWPRALFIEFKRAPNKLTKEQEEVKRGLQARGWHYFVCYSLSEAIEIADSYLLHQRGWLQK